MPRFPSNEITIPFTPADEERIVQTGRLSIAPGLKAPVNYSGFDLTRLQTSTILTWPPQLPERDPRGQLSAPQYRHWKKASEGRIGIAGNYYSFKAGGVVPCQSALERRFLVCAEFDPNIVEIRAQYALWGRADYLACKHAGLRLPKHLKITLDFMTTLRAGDKFHYHAVSVKPYEFTSETSEIKRHKKEFGLVDSWNFTHQFITEHSMPSQLEINCRRLFENMRYVEDVEVYQVRAAALGEYMSNKTVLDICDWEIRDAAQHFGWSRHETYRVFGIANFLGYLRVDHVHDLLPHKPLHLQMPNQPVINFWSNPWLPVK